MNSKDNHVDLRVRRTRKLLWEALLDLMMEKEFETITVKELCDRAMVHRTTFYSHYQDKYDLLEQGIQAMYNELASMWPSPEEALAQFEWHTPPKSFIHIYKHTAENHNFYHRMLCRPGISTFRKQLRQYFLEYAQARFQSFAFPNSPVPAQPILYFIVGAMLELVTWWVESECPHTPEEMALYSSRLITYGVYPTLGIDPQNFTTETIKPKP